MTADPAESVDLAARYPDIVKRMRRDYEAWFRDVTADLAPVRIHLGSPHHNPLVLNNQDLFGPEAAISYSSHSRLSRNPKEEPEGTGVWNVHVVRAGRYEIALRFGHVNKDVLGAPPERPGRLSVLGACRSCRRRRRGRAGRRASSSASPRGTARSKRLSPAKEPTAGRSRRSSSKSNFSAGSAGR